MRIPSPSFRNRITGMVLVLFLAGIWSLILIVTSVLEREMTSHLETQQLDTAAYIAETISVAMKQRVNALKALATQITPELLADPPRLACFLSGKLLVQTFFPTGVVVISNEGRGIADHPLLPDRASASYAELEYFRETVETGEPSVGKPRIGRFSRIPVIGMAVPIFGPDHRRMAILAGFIELSDQALFGAVERSGRGDFKDWLLIASSKHRVFINGSDPTRRLTPTPETGVNPLFDRFMEGWEGSGITLNARNVRLFMSARQVPWLRWFVRVGMPLEDAFAPIREMRARLFGVGAILSLLVSLVVWLLIRRSLGVLETAGGLIQGMTDGSLPFQEIPVERDDEMGRLLTCVNRHMLMRRQQEEHLALFNEKLQLAVGAASAGVWEWELATNVLTWDDQMYKLYGTSRDRFDGGHADWESMIHQDDLLRVQETVQEALRRENTFEVDFRIVWPDLTVRHLQLHGKILRDASETPIRVIGLNRDITEERLLQSEREQFFRFFNQATDLMIITDLDGVFRKVNPAFSALLGYRESDVLGKCFIDFVHPDDFKATMDVLSWHFPTGSSLTFENRYRSMGGANFWLSWQVKFDLREGVLFASARDITASKEAAEAMEKMRSLLALTSETAMMGGWELEIETGRMIWTDQVFAILEEGPEYLPTLNRMIGFFAREVQEKVATAMIRVTEEGIPFDHELELITAHQNRRVVRLVGEATQEKGRLARVSGTIQDLTEVKQAEALLTEKTRQLEELNRDLELRVSREVEARTRNEQILMQKTKLAAMGEMLGAIAHQWRQPLNTLGLVIQNLKNALAFGELDRGFVEKTVEKSMRQIQHMSGTIEDFRNFFLPDKARTRFDAMRSTASVLSLVSAQLASRRIDFRMTCHTHGTTFLNTTETVDCREKTIRGFRTEFEHVVLNLVGNARDAIIEYREKTGGTLADPGLISFDFRLEDGRVILEVEDNGGGIPADVLERVFEPYFTTKSPQQGTGLGLYMANMIITQMDGTLSVRNGPHGAVFRISLPMAGEEPAGESPGDQV